jgi:hypothetical protein
MQSMEDVDVYISFTALISLDLRDRCDTLFGEFNIDNGPWFSVESAAFSGF